MCLTLNAPLPGQRQQNLLGASRGDRVRSEAPTALATTKALFDVVHTMQYTTVNEV